VLLRRIIFLKLPEINKKQHENRKIIKAVEKYSNGDHR